MEIMRLVVTGPVGAGKSSFIRAVSEIEVVDTDRVATDETALLKQKTTVAMDFGRLQFSPDMALHLYGTPGQARFDFMWEILIKKAHAFILLVPANRPQEFRNAKKILNFMNHFVRIPLLVGLTHCDLAEAWQPENVRLAIGILNRDIPVITVNATSGTSAANAILTLLSHSMSQPILSQAL